jgi:D-proline reductase (dithiol) PrdB
MQAEDDVRYMQRTREFYRAQGYSNDYQWAANASRPFTPLTKPLSACRVGVITTAMPDTPEGRTNRGVYALASTPAPRSMHTAELSWDKEATHTEDVDSFLPLAALNEARQRGTVGDLAQRFYTVPTDYSQRNTCEKDAPMLLNLCREDAVDVALLVPL